ncbi:hypothetical protein J6590_059168 [Homalodisca vitripennis]|nr:hypothetical protein J6590_059168 [Homalodisca vitripennis]
MAFCAPLFAQIFDVVDHLLTWPGPDVQSACVTWTTQLSGRKSVVIIQQHTEAKSHSVANRVRTGASWLTYHWET